MKTIIYGIGKEYKNIFHNKILVDSIIGRNGFEVIGFSDGNKDIWGDELIYNGQEFIVRNINEFQRERADCILITTHKYFNEIKTELLVKGYREEQILSVDKFYRIHVEQLLCMKELEGKIGIEIGGPTELFDGIYSRCMNCDNVNFSLDTVWGKNEINNFLFEGTYLGKMLVMDATDMSGIEDGKYEFVLSSNNIEHIANPLKALKEFSRIVKSGGLVEVIVPRKDDTFDHNREYTAFEHLWEDYVNDVGEEDLTHLQEIIEQHDYDMDIECKGKSNFIERAKKNYKNRCLHQHVFDEKCLRKSFEFAGLEIKKFGSLIGNWCIVGVKSEGR